MHYLYGSKKGAPSRLVATFGSEQQLLAYVRWATLQDLGDRHGKFEQGSALASYKAWGVFSRVAHRRGGGVRCFSIRLHQRFALLGIPMNQNPISPAIPESHFAVRVLRQDRPDLPSYWQTFSLERAPGMNVTSVLQHIAAHPQTASGHHVGPVAYDANCLEEVCGACTMLINGRVRQACSALVDRLLEQHPQQIELRPMSKFPVIRDLTVDRRRLFRALEKLQCWIARAYR